MTAAGLSLAVQLGPNGFWWTNLFVLVGIYALLGLSLNLINGYARMFSLGQHGFWAMGAYAAAWLTRDLYGGSPDLGIFVASCLFAMAVAGVGWGRGFSVVSVTEKSDSICVSKIPSIFQYP